MYIYNVKDSNKKVVAGKVIKFNTFVKDGVKGAAVEIEDWRGDKLTIFFKDKNGSVSKLEKAKLAPGRFATFMVMKSDEDETATGLSMQWRGFQITDTEGKEIANVLSGKVFHFEQDDPAKCKVRMFQTRPGMEDRWINIYFHDEYASRAAKVMADAGDREFAVSCGKIAEKTDSKGNPKYECSGYTFNAAPGEAKKKAEKPAPEAEPAKEAAPVTTEFTSIADGIGDSLFDDEP